MYIICKTSGLYRIHVTLRGVVHTSPPTPSILFKTNNKVIKSFYPWPYFTITSTFLLKMEKNQEFWWVTDKCTVYGDSKNTHMTIEYISE